MATYDALHTDVRHVLRRWVAPDAQQEALRTAFLNHLDDHPDAVAKAGPGAHLTASCLVLDASGEHVLLTHHKRAGQWFQFGGHLEPGDRSVLEAARREAREESGLDHLSPTPTPVQLDRHVLVGDFGACREHLDIRYAALAPERSMPRVSTESHDVRWWPVAALPAGTANELQPLVSACRRALGLCAP
ncbi:MAG: NUDIX domain-containing protein [Ornithinibacter sp.]